MHIIVWEIIKYYYDMNISYNWLKEYVDFDLTPDEVAAALTSIGLETGGVEGAEALVRWKKFKLSREDWKVW